MGAKVVVVVEVDVVVCDLMMVMKLMPLQATKVTRKRNYYFVLKVSSQQTKN